MATPTDIAAPLRIPAILQNPTSVSQRQVEAHNAQQREKLAARREAKARSASGGTGGGKGIGKRVVRRIDNASFIDNPHIVQPRRTDLFPSVPLHPRPSRPSFPSSALDRSVPLPPAAGPDRDPFSDSSLNGAFTTSLKGTRALLRKRGHRAEGLVTRLETTVRGWLGGDWIEREGWDVIDDQLVDVEFEDEAEDRAAGISISTSPLVNHLLVPPSSRRLPPQHRIQGLLPPLPLVEADGARGVKQVPAVLELSRSVAHLTLAAADPFDRLVIHLVARYYECLSWSEEHTSSPTRPVRLTHLIIPSIARPRASATNPLLTPETTDISDQSSQSGSELSSAEQSPAGSASEGEDSSETETETERGTEVDPDETYRAEEISTHLSALSLDGSDAPHHPLERVLSASSSTYASSEAESDTSSVGAMGDSMMMFPPIPVVGASRPRPSWVEDDASEVGEGTGRGGARQGQGLGLGQGQGQGVGRREGWADKPTFFEYLYGA